MPSYDVMESVTESDTEELWPVYDAVFPDQADYVGWRVALWDRHAARAGFRLARARDGDRLVGFAYGYTGDRGQWWTDQAARVLPPRRPRPGWVVTSSWSASACSTRHGATASAPACCVP